MAHCVTLFLGPLPVNSGKRKTKRMAPETTTNNETASAIQSKEVTKTVFDLTLFDDVKLTKTVALPPAPATLEAALATVGNDLSKFLATFHAGLCESTIESAKATIDGFLTVGEDGEPGAPYAGKFAEGDVNAKINALVLAIAQANGYSKSMKPEKKAEIKANARDFIRKNPSMIAGLIPVAAAAPVVSEDPAATPVPAAG